MSAVESVLDDGQLLGQRDLIHIDPVEFDDGDPHGDPATGMGFERFVTDQKVDVLRRARPAAVRIRAERHQRVADACVEEHLRDFADGALKRGNGPQGACELGFTAGFHTGASMNGNLRSHTRRPRAWLPVSIVAWRGRREGSFTET
ncbi:MAG: hypothetical protein ACRD3V_02465 [Vicinamibacteria bacterium]